MGIESVPLKSGGGNIWIDVGDGTARNLEFIPVDTIKQYFSQIFIVDVSASLLEVARRRVKKMGLSNFVTLIEHDFTKDSIFEVIPKFQGKVDLVTFSYSLSMIPDKVGAIDAAFKFLKKKIMEKIQKSTECVWDERFRGSVPLIPMLRPYHGAYVARTKSKSA